MARRTLSCIISLLFCLLCGEALHAQGQSSTRPAGTTQSSKKAKKKAERIYYPLYNGVSVGVDLWGPGAKLLGSDNLSAEVSADVNLKNRYFPAVELGYGHSDSWNDNGIHYQAKGPYMRIGMDYNALYNKAHGHMLLVGLRYAVSSFKYDVETPALEDPIYGGAFGNPNLVDGIWNDSQPYKHTGMKGAMHWLEFGVGIRAHVLKNFYMGWGLRFRFKVTDSKGTYGDPWYVPGFGTYGSNKLGVHYSLTYKLPW